MFSTLLYLSNLSLRVSRNTMFSGKLHLPSCVPILPDKVHIPEASVDTTEFHLKLVNIFLQSSGTVWNFNTEDAFRTKQRVYKVWCVCVCVCLWAHKKGTKEKPWSCVCVCVAIIGQSVLFDGGAVYVLWRGWWVIWTVPWERICSAKHVFKRHKHKLVTLLSYSSTILIVVCYKL